MKKQKKDIFGLEKKLKESEKLIKIISRGKYQWQATFDAISDPVMIIKKDGSVVRANLAVSRVAEKDIRKVVGKKCYKVFAGKTARCANCPVADAIRGEKPRARRIGEEIHGRDFVVNTFPFMDEIDREESIIVHYRDITEEKRLQQELIQQEKMAAIGMLAGGVAHEINNPLGGIIAFAQLIKRDLTEDNPLYADIEEIERAANRCKKIVSDLLDFSRISSGKKKQWMEVNPLIEKVMPFIKMELKSLNIDLDMKLEEGLPRIYGDVNRLEQVFLNLLTNACHSMAKGGKLTIETYSSKGDSAVCVQVADTGCGIAKEDLSKVFDPFFTTKAPGRGTGLGLSISYRIVRDHGGMIQVDSRSGKGSVFTVRLPSVRSGGQVLTLDKFGKYADA